MASFNIRKHSRIFHNFNIRNMRILDLCSEPQFYIDVSSMVTHIYYARRATFHV